MRASSALEIYAYMHVYVYVCVYVCVCCVCVCVCVWLAGWCAPPLPSQCVHVHTATSRLDDERRLGSTYYGSTYTSISHLSRALMTSVLARLELSAISAVILMRAAL